MLKILLLLIVLGAAGGYFYPGWNEHADGPCQALERRVSTLVQQQLQTLPPTADARLSAALNAIRTALPMGGVANAYVQDRFPALPPEIACVGAYWKLQFDPTVTKFTTGALPVLQKKK